VKSPPPVPPPPAPGDKEKKKPDGNIASAAKSILEKYMRRPAAPKPVTPAIQRIEIDFSGEWFQRPVGAGRDVKWEAVCKTPARIELRPGEEYCLQISSRVTDADLAGLAHLRGLTALLGLSLMGCRKITDAGLAHLRGLAALQGLSLKGCDKITDAGLAHFDDLTALRELDLASCKEITDAGLAHLGGLTALQKLDLMGCERVTDAGLAHLCEPTIQQLLDSLDMDPKQTTDADLGDLGGLTALQELDLVGCNEITDAGVAALQQALPRCKIRH
jgi:hypothetical protein